MEEAQGNCLNLVKCYVPHPQVIVAWPLFLYSRNIKSSLVLQQYLTNVLISVCFFAFLATHTTMEICWEGARPVWCGWTTPLRGEPCFSWQGGSFLGDRGEKVEILRFWKWFGLSLWVKLVSLNSSPPSCTAPQPVLRPCGLFAQSHNSHLIMDLARWTGDR